jgi:hypothetical protein
MGSDKEYARTSSQRQEISIRYHKSGGREERRCGCRHGGVRPTGWGACGSTRQHGGWQPSFAQWEHPVRTIGEAGRAVSANLVTDLLSAVLSPLLYVIDRKAAKIQNNTRENSSERNSTGSR